MTGLNLVNTAYIPDTARLGFRTMSNVFYSP